MQVLSVCFIIYKHVMRGWKLKLSQSLICADSTQNAWGWSFLGGGIFLKSNTQMHFLVMDQKTLTLSWSWHIVSSFVPSVTVLHSSEFMRLPYCLEHVISDIQLRMYTILQGLHHLMLLRQIRIGMADQTCLFHRVRVFHQINAVVWFRLWRGQVWYWDRIWAFWACSGGCKFDFIACLVEVHSQNSVIHGDYDTMFYMIKLNSEWRTVSLKASGEVVDSSRSLQGTVGLS